MSRCGMLFPFIVENTDFFHEENLALQCTYNSFSFNFSDFWKHELWHESAHTVIWSKLIVLEYIDLSVVCDFYWEINTDKLFYIKVIKLHLRYLNSVTNKSEKHLLDMVQ